MLRITIHDLGTVCRLELAGRLEGPWVGETELAWRSLLGPDKQIEVDLRQLTGIDDCGRELLSAMYQAEVSLVGEGVWMTALIEELTAGNHFNPTTRRPPTKKIRADRGCGNRRNTK
jgi:hypothetical protein